MKNIQSILFLFFIVTVNLSYAQIDSTGLESETVSVVKSYEAQIQRAQQRKINVEAPIKKKVNTSYSYKLNNKTDIDFEREDPVIRPLTFSDDNEVVPDEKDGILYGAYGNNRTIKLGGAYQYYIEDWLDSGIQIDHHSNKSINTVSQYSPSTNITKGRLYASYFLSKRTKIGIEGRGALETREAFIVPDINSSEMIFDLPTNIYGGALNFSHTSFERLGLALRSRLSYDRMQQTIERETNLSTTENLLSIDNNLFKKINDNISIESDVNVRRITLNTDETNLSSNDLILRPQIRYKSDFISAKIGAEVIRGNENNYLFPIVNIGVVDIYESIDVRFYTDSDYSRSDMQYLNRVNPFITYNLNSIRPIYEQNYNLLISRNMNVIEPSLEFTYSRFINEIQFVNFSDINTLMSSLFEIEYLDRSELSFTPRVTVGNDIVNMDLNFTYHHFLNTDAADILYRPQYEIGFTARETLFSDKLTLCQGIVYSAKRFGRNSNGLNSELDPILDISLTLDYQLSNTFTIYGEAYNLLDSPYEVWNGIDNYGRQFWGGIRFKF